MKGEREEALEACPWCKEARRLDTCDSTPNQSSVICMACGASGPLIWGHEDNAAEARKKWNQHLLSSSKAEGEMREAITSQAAIDEVENAFLAAANKDFPLLHDIRQRLRALSKKDG